MQALRGFLPAGLGGQQQEQQQSSLLSDWQSYQQQTDVEAGGPATVSGRAQEIGGSILTFFRSGYSTVSDGISNASVPSLESSGIPSGEQLMYFFALLGGGMFFLFMAFFIFLPVIILAPSKFALAFTIGCCLVLSAFAALKGWRRQAALMLERERLPFTAGYLGSVGLTLYAAIFLHSYLLSLGASALQVVALLYYLTSYYPGGTDSVRWFLSMFASAASRCFGMLFSK
ncbi:MAG: Got1/Sft2-like family-domain-containing protein [Monoraphidium minutum]|nr:MAG: Got1/Sft2-like family-domain-containing protein [Monoraphidium minutum]